MQEQPINPGKFSINYGVMLGLIMIVISVILYVTGWALEGVQWPQYLYYIIFPIVIIYAISKYKKDNANVLTLSQALKAGVIIGVISAIVYVLYGLIFNYIIDPEFMGQLQDAARDNLIEQNPEFTDEMVEQSMKVVGFLSNPLIGSAFWIAMSAIFGLIYSLIGGLIMKNDN